MSEDPASAATLLGDPRATLDSNGASEAEGQVQLRSQLLGGRFEIEGLVGSGGMGTVYRARDRELDEVVALKMLKATAVSAEELDRFRREVKLARRVTHRNVARLYEFGDDEGRPFFTMELVEGESLRQKLLRNKTLSARATLEIAVAVCEGLVAAHAVGVIHRDLKPDNVLLGKDGRIAITDFGIAASNDERGEATAAVFIGTPDYMAPEQVDGSSPPDARTDVYAFGVLLFELLSGRPPFAGTNAVAVAAARLTNNAPSLADVAADVPGGLVWLVDRCLSRAPSGRFASASELLQALQTAMADPALTLSAPPASLPRKATPPVAATLKLAVLPFNDGGLEGHEYLAVGLTEDLIDSLSASKSVRVVAYGAAATAERAHRDPRAIGRDLGVDVVVYGSLRRAEEARLCITVRMVSVTDGIQLWSRRFESSSGEVLRVNDAIAKAVLGAIPGGSAPAETELEDPVAVELYLRARSRFREFWYESANEAESLYAQALQRVPNSPILVAGHALALTRCAFFKVERLPEAREAAIRALLLAPELGEALIAAGAVALQEGRLTESYRYAQQALARAPSLVDAHLLKGRILAETGPLADAEQTLEIAIELDPRSIAGLMELARVQALLGRWDSVAKTLAAGAQGDRTFSVEVTQLRVALWTSDSQSFEGARAAVARMRATLETSVPRFVNFLDQLISVTVEPGAIEALIRQLERTEGASRRALFFHQIGMETSVALGQDEVALALFRNANRLGLTDLSWVDLCPALDRLRAKPEFLAQRAVVHQRVAEVLQLHASGTLTR
jgi:serine/threonine protein kinase/tetratricopeptide (TPR) repeat protein